MRIGILGGSFDPIHNAHLKLALAAMEEAHLDQVWFMPTAVSYHKGHPLSPNEDRVAMLKAAIAPYPRFFVSLIDIERGGNTYTYETLREVKKRCPDCEPYFIVGEDSLLYMDCWQHAEEIFQNAVILSARRPGSYTETSEEKCRELTERFGARIQLLMMEECDISSHHIRELSEKGKDISGLVPAAVAAYIDEHHLYEPQAPVTPDELKKALQKTLKPTRFAHTLGVADTARAMAPHFGVSPEDAYLAGLLHDCAKYLTDEELYNRCQMAGIPISPAEEKSRFLLHAKLGAYYAKERYHVQNLDILNAVRFHTTGRAAMSSLEEIVYIADYIEPGRKEAPHLDKLRMVAFENLDLTVALIAKNTMEYLQTSDRFIDPASEETYRYYQKFLLP